MPQFNTGQMNAIRHVNGPMMALAGPGSGKTTAMVHRIKYLIENAKIDPRTILVITFTRASAKEMEERFYRLMGGRRYPCTFGTFHSVFFSILKLAYGYTAQDIISEEEKYCIIRDLVRKTKFEVEDEEDLIQSIISEIGVMKGDMIPLEHFYSGCLGEDVFRELYLQYERIVTGKGKLDFDDMMVYCYELLIARADILKGLQNRYRYILVDEFQDINKIQYEITKLLAKPNNNLFIVGDDDQSIYGFRGAKPEIMLHFKDDYPDVTTTLLDVNYRCSRNVTEGALRLISNNTARFDKKIISSNDFEEPIRIHHVQTIGEENSHVLSQIKEYVKEGIPYDNIAIIVRTNIQARGIVNRLMEYTIPFQVRDRVPCIYDHFAVKNVLDYIRMAMGNRDRDLIMRIINKPNRYVSRELLLDSYIDFKELKDSVANKEWIAERIQQLEYELKILSGLKPFAAVHFVRKAIGYDEYLREYAEYRHLNVEDLYGVLDELQEMAKQYKTFSEWFDGIDEYRVTFEMHTKQDPKEKTGVVVTTMHSAKGLEFDAVFILEANEGMTPYKKATKPEEIEEERRMFYVAMTRAKSHLHIYNVKEYFNKQLEVSRFVTEVLSENEK